MIVGDDRYKVEQDRYCSAGTDILKNKASLRDPALLRDFKLDMSVLRSREALPEGDFDPSHYRAIHRHLFQDVYTWAGKYRDVRIAKGKNAFCYPEYIEAEANKLFRKLEGDAFAPGISRAKFIEAASDFLAELNAIHCFRDGNGRAQLTFMHLVARRAGHPMRLERVKRETSLPAIIASFDGELTALRGEGSCRYACIVIRQHGREQFANARRIVLVDRSGQTFSVHFMSAGKSARANSLGILCQPFQIMQQIDQKEFLANALGERHTTAKLVRTTVEFEPSMPLVVVDDWRVVELGRADAEAVIGVGRQEQKPVIAQK
jgi:cell filamentation protein